MKMAAEDFRKVLKSGDVTKIAEADVKFHDIIFAATNNQRLITLLNNLREQMYRFLRRISEAEGMLSTASGRT